MTQQAVKDDLEFLRDMADAGAYAPLLGGRFLAWWGAVITLAYGFHYAISTGQTGLAPESVGLMWVAVIIFGLVGYFVIGALFPRGKPGASSAGNRASIVWTSAGLSIFAFFLGAVPAAMTGQVPPEMLNYSLPLVFAVYACALMVTGGLARNRTLIGAAWLSVILVAATSFLAQSEAVYLVAMAGVFLCAFLPGLLLMKSEPKSVV